MTTPTTTGGRRSSASREVAGHNSHAPCSVTLENEMEALILSPEELAGLFADVATTTNGYPLGTQQEAIGIANLRN